MKCKDYIWDEHKKLRGLTFSGSDGYDDQDAEEDAKSLRHPFGDPDTKEGATQLLELMTLLFEQERYSSVSYLWKQEMKWCLGWPGYVPLSKAMTLKVLNAQNWQYLPARIVLQAQSLRVDREWPGERSRECRDNWRKMQIWAVRKDFIGVPLVGGDDWWRKVRLDRERVHNKGRRFKMYVKALEVISPYDKETGRWAWDPVAEKAKKEMWK